MPRGPCWRHPSDWILSGGVTMASEALRCRAGSPYPATPDDMAGSSDSSLHPTPSLRLTSLRMKTPVKAGPCPPGPSTLTPVAPAGLLFLRPKPELHQRLSETTKLSPRHALASAELLPMDQAQLSSLTNFIWNIADDVLRDVYVRGRYRDIILPMTVLRRLDAVLEPTKQEVLDMKAALDREKIVHQDDALRDASGQAFYNTSPFLLRDLKSRATQQKLKDDFEAYLDGFSPNVQDILTNFEFRNQIPRLSKADALGQLIEKFLDRDFNISPQPVGDLPALDNHSMGTMFEELVRRFNEENNEEAGEHWTPRDAVRLMANLMFLPVADRIESGTYLLYDCACGTGGMLTVAEETLQQIARTHGKQVATHLYGQEINGETYAICKADLLLKGDGDAADNIVGGPEYSTLANDAFSSLNSILCFQTRLMARAGRAILNEWVEKME